MGHCLAMVRKRKIIVYIAASADGFISRSDDSVDWLERPRPKSNYRVDGKLDLSSTSDGTILRVSLLVANAHASAAGMH